MNASATSEAAIKIRLSQLSLYWIRLSVASDTALPITMGIGISPSCNPDPSSSVRTRFSIRPLYQRLVRRRPAPATMRVPELCRSAHPAADETEIVIMISATEQRKDTQ